ncbi:uncharacterized protein N7477_005430 [Penicillium maclennaniae]|uniref:uncharacterized protein n=1 Tax=Penicillium maclennaniae TaxID=1343394 RepID=UPI002541EAFD|nr:uncharacterized protein N7477_005430 [Penicillium maclennaniae]KAJ5670067.1 hypothetical protein N7477_005430 [Penicillium maclennaniae]
MSGVTTSIWTMDTLGRRKLLLGGSVGRAVSHIVIAILIAKHSYDWESHQTMGWVSAAFLLFYMVAFGASWGPIPWALPAGVALSTCSNWLNNFIIGLITPPLIENTGYGAYVFFAVFCVLSEQMDHVFKDNSSEQEQARRRAIEVELLNEHLEYDV